MANYSTDESEDESESNQQRSVSQIDPNSFMFCKILRLNLDNKRKSSDHLGDKTKEIANSSFQE